TLPGEVIVQTYTPDHYSIELASQYDFIHFYEKEMKIRHAFLYPPYMYLVLFTISHESKAEVYKTATTLTQRLANVIQRNTVILGPSPSPMARLKNRYRYQIMIKYRNKAEITALIDAELSRLHRDKNLQITVDFN